MVFILDSNAFIMCDFIEEFKLIQYNPLLTQFVCPLCICSNWLMAAWIFIQVRLTAVLFAMSEQEMRDKCDKHHIVTACTLCVCVCQKSCEKKNKKKLQMSARPNWALISFGISKRILFRYRHSNGKHVMIFDIYMNILSHNLPKAYTCACTIYICRTA